MGDTPRVLLAHPGTQHSFELARQLAPLGLLQRFWTRLAFTFESSGTGFGSPLFRILPRGATNRVLQGVPRNLVRTRPLEEIRSLASRYLSRDPLGALISSTKRFQDLIPSEEIASSDVVIGFDTVSWVLARRSSALGKPFVLDRSAPHPGTLQRVLERFRRLKPDWSRYLPASSPELWDFQAIEHRCANRIVVASSFSAASLEQEGIDSSGIEKIPYGVDLLAFSCPMRASKRQEVRFLFPGGQRVLKGLPFLLDAWSEICGEGASLTILGVEGSPGHPCLSGVPKCRIVPRIPRYEMPDLMSQHEVLLFPTLFDGFGLVILEAMASGLPVIATEASAGPDVITSGVDGLVIESGNSRQLARAMRYFLDHPNRILDMGKAARKTAEQYSWEKYGWRWRQVLYDVTTGSG